MNRNIFALLCTLSTGAGAVIASLFLAAPAPAQQFTGGNGWDVPGNDYAVVTPRNVQDCMNACENDGRCRASVFVYLPNNRYACYLKSAVSRPVANRPTFTYIKLIQSIVIEYRNNAFGFDYNHFTYAGVDPNPCMNACRNDGRCASWSFVFPNRGQGPLGTCWLKWGLPPLVLNDCCVSGRVR